LQVTFSGLSVSLFLTGEVLADTATKGVEKQQGAVIMGTWNVLLMCPTRWIGCSFIIPPYFLGMPIPATVGPELE